MEYDHKCGEKESSLQNVKIGGWVMGGVERGRGFSMPMQKADVQMSMTSERYSVLASW